MTKTIFYKTIKDVFRQISRRRFKSFMTFFSIAIATVTILLVASSNSYLNTSLDMQLGPQSELSVNYTSENSNKKYGFTNEDKELVNKISGVKSVKLQSEGLSRQLVTKMFSNQSQRTVRSLNEVKINSQLSLLSGTLTDIQNGSATSVLISDELAKQALKGKDNFKKIIGENILLNDKTLHIAGVYYTTSDPNLLPDIIVSQKALTTIVPKSYDTMVVKTTGENETLLKYLVANQLNKNGSNKDFGRYSIINNQKALAESKSAANAGQFMFIMIGGVSLFVAGFGVMNALYGSISERKKEIGIRRSLGATPWDIQLSFQIEGTILTVIGSIIGIAIALIISGIGKLFDVSLTISLGSVLISFILAIIIGIIFSYIPAIKASTQNVIEALHD